MDPLDQAAKLKNESLVEAVFLGRDELGLSAQTEDADLLSFGNYVRAFMQNCRQGTVGCKTRAQVSFSGKKPFRQKGTGNARAGTRRSPLWRKGGVIFGPLPRVRHLKLNKAVSKKVLRNLFFDFIDRGGVVSVDLDFDKCSTAAAFKTLKRLDLHDTRIVLFSALDDFFLCNSFANLSGVNILFFDEPCAYAMSCADYLVFLKKDLDKFKSMVSLWI